MKTFLGDEDPEAAEQIHRSNELESQLHASLRIALVGSKMCNIVDLASLATASRLLSATVPYNLPSIMTRPSILKDIDRFHNLEKLHLVFDRHSESTRWRVPIIIALPEKLRHLAKLQELDVRVLDDCMPFLPLMQKSSRPSSLCRWLEIDDPLSFLVRSLPQLDSLHKLKVVYCLQTPEPIHQFMRDINLGLLHFIRLELPSYVVVMELVCDLVEEGLCPNLRSIVLAHSDGADAPAATTLRLLKILSVDGMLPQLTR